MSLSSRKFLPFVSLSFVYCLSFVSPSVQPPLPPQSLEILLTNDDGYNTPGIQTLRNALIAAGHHVVLVAPSSNRSGSSASLTLGAVGVQQIAPDIYAVDGSPATTVLLGAANFFPQGGPDLVISGPNEGANIGPATAISGTVGAATIATSPIGPRVPAIAISADLVNPNDPGASENIALYNRESDFVVRLIQRLCTTACGGHLLPEGLALNVNYPSVAPQQLAGVKVCVQGRVSNFQLTYNQVAPGIYAPSGAPVQNPGDDVNRSDVTAYGQGYVTVVPIDGDLTAAVGQTFVIGARLHHLNP